MRFALIEDNPVFASALARSLERHGHQTATAATADAARTLCKEHAFDAAILDLHLGDDNGLLLIEPLLALQPELRILVLTGYASIATAIDAIKRGAFNYLPKPATALMILEALEAQADADSPPADGAPHRVDPISLKRLEWEHIQQVLAANDYNISATARALGMHRRTLQRKLAKKPVAE